MTNRRRTPVLKVEALGKSYKGAASGFFGVARTVTAVKGVSLEIGEGETMAVVGESGAGKSTLARLVMQLERPDAGTVHLSGRLLTGLGPRKLRPHRRDFQAVFQDPWESLDPRMSIGESLEEPLKAMTSWNARKRRRRVEEILARVGLDASVLAGFPHEFSGGQLQRICIARALAVVPKLLVLDEPVASLDPLTREGILELLVSLQKGLKLSCLLIAHRMEVVRRLSGRTAVMFRGRFVETGPTCDVLSKPLHPYTFELLRGSAITGPGEDRKEGRLSGDGCGYEGQCRFSSRRCGGAAPLLAPAGANRQTACYRAVSAVSIAGKSGNDGV